MSGKFTQSAIYLMNALLYLKIQQAQTWHEGLEMILTLSLYTIFNLFLKKCKHMPSIEHA